MSFIKVNLFCVVASLPKRPLACRDPLGMEDGTIANKQITASSKWDGNHLARLGRLHLNASGDIAGGWVAGIQDTNQWYQIDLYSHYTKVTGVATQGREDYPQWVTNYKLQYGNDGVSFEYYKEQGNVTDKVK